MTVTSTRSALSALRAERRQAAPVYVVAGRYDRSAIMREAVRVARGLRAGGATWGWRMRIALRTVWGWAKAAMTAPPAQALRPVPSPAMGQSDTTPRSRVRVFHRGSRIFSHGW